MAEHPIPFSAPLVREILAGRKTQTRRVVAASTSEMGSGRFADCDLSRAWIDPGGTHLFGPGPYLKAPAQHDGEELVHRIYPRVGSGDRLWVREPLRPAVGVVTYDADGATALGANGRARFWPWKVRYLASRYCPRWASRLTLRVTEVRVERVQDISEEDARAEGVEHPANARGSFSFLWDSINAARGFGWDANPWVWVIGFELKRAARG